VDLSQVRRMDTVGAWLVHRDMIEIGSR